jgi:hypothetical protein
MALAAIGMVLNFWEINAALRDSRGVIFRGKATKAILFLGQ